jgi:uncharacterized protein involved in exopolysaccharide biosynthesis/Mrp family chromosome partitioning ATPase
MAARMFTRSSTQSALDDAIESPALARIGGVPLDLHGLWTILRWRARLIGAVTLGTIILAGAALAVLPPKYAATTIVLIDPRQPRVTTSEAVLSGIGSDAAAVESQVELIESSALAQKVIAKLQLDRDPEFTEQSVISVVTDGLRTLMGRSADNSPEAAMNRLVYRFLSGLSVKRRGLTYVLEITYSSKDPHKAARIANAMAEAYVDDQRAAKAEITKRATGWLDDRIEEMRARVRDSERAVADYKASISSVNVTQGNPLISRQIEDLTQQLTLAHTRSAEAQARLDRVQALRGDSSTMSEALQSTVIANLRSQYAEVARSEAEQSAVLGARHPAIIGLRAQLARLRTQIDGEIKRIQAGVRNDFQVAKAREASLEKELARLKAENSRINQDDVKLHELEREAQANRTLFEQFLGRAKETGEQQSLQLADARIVAPALVPIRPSRPPLLVLLVLAAIGGAILSIALVMLLEQFRRGFRTTDDVERALQYPALGVIPESGAGASGATSRKTDAAAVPPADAIAQAVFNNPASAFASSLSKMRNRLRRAPAVPDREVLAVLSTLPGEGKSTIACNLALASAATGVRTLLVDADTYTASTSRMFGLQGPGLRDVLQGRASLRDATVQDADTGLHVLGIDPAEVGAMDKTDRARGLAFVSECHKHYELVVVDSPAILTAAGNIPLLESVDRAVLVIEWERTDRQAVADALNVLGTQATKIAGAVLNKTAANWFRLVDDRRHTPHRNDASRQVAAIATHRAETSSPLAVRARRLPRAVAPQQSVTREMAH